MLGYSFCRPHDELLCLSEKAHHWGLLPISIHVHTQILTSISASSVQIKSTGLTDVVS